ncbi:hypothetical protein [Anabaena sp. UHCC 0204]|uniref:PIN-like domain-containing protein n=1 Tax=Anabaena sp. UHCC 0204 TaxID=2590009 RepID=UPI001445CD3A|nr:hypothetical protein [Anabaena sp. UHCC 0204]MTJ09777.1 hypothetical protein [Anabaena sp. UHCC 0204]
MTQPQSITFFIDRCLGKKSIPETLRTAGITIEIHDDHFDKGALDVDWLPQEGVLMNLSESSSLLSVSSAPGAVRFSYPNLE